MPTPTKLTSHVLYKRVLWSSAAASYLASIVTAAVMLAIGVQIDWQPIILWFGVVANLTIGAMLVTVIPSAEAIAVRALMVARADAEDELADRRAKGLS